MTQLNRRNFVSMLGAAGASAAMPSAALAAAPAQSFTFLFVTDAHLEPERNAAIGTSMAFKHARTNVKADFALQGGDHVFDVMGASKARALALFDLYGKTEQDLGMKVYHTIGNHDILGISGSDDVRPGDPLYGKKLYEDRFGSLHHSFDHKGHHFIVLDSVSPTPDLSYEGRIDPAQLKWLAADLAAQPAGTPIVISSHIPIISAFEQYADPAPTKETIAKHHGLTVANANEVVPLFEGHNVIGVLQGHTHINERVEYKGVPYITSGAVSGNWWQGTRMGFPEGYTVVEVANGKLTTRYQTYGFKTIDPHNT